MLANVKNIPAGLAFICLAFTSAATLADDGNTCTVNMTPGDGVAGTADVTIGNNRIRVKIDGTLPDTLYTVWITFGGSPDRPAGASSSAPAMAITSPMYNGMRTDENGFFTDEAGVGKLKNYLGYDLMATGAAPVTTGHNLQGLNRVGRNWMRVYGVDKNLAASVQLVDTNGTPLVERATPTGIAIVSHPDTTTHGGSPGVGGVDQFGAFKGALIDCI